MRIKETLRVEVRSRQGLVFEGDLAAVSSYNNRGLFDVLPRHTNFVTMISRKLILRRQDNRREEIDMQDGVMLVEENRVKVFLGVQKA